MMREASGFYQPPDVIFVTIEHFVAQHQEMRDDAISAPGCASDETMNQGILFGGKLEKTVEAGPGFLQLMQIIADTGGAFEKLKIVVTHSRRARDDAV